MTNGLGDPSPSFATWIEANLEKKNTLNSTFGAKKTEV